MNAKQWRFDDQFVHWALSLQFIGGKGLVEWLRGAGGKKADESGHYSPENLNIILPSTRTLRGYGPVPQPYGSLKEDSVQKVIEGLPKGKK